MDSATREVRKVELTAEERKMRELYDALRSIESGHVYAALRDELREICADLRGDYEGEHTHVFGFDPDDAWNCGYDFECGFWDGVKATLLLLQRRGWIKKGGETDDP